MKIKRLHLTILLALAAMLTATAQSPYSRYGYGLLSDNATSAQRAMGGVGYAMNSGRQINVMNPASYAYVDSLTFLFDMGLNATALWSKDGDARGKDFGGGLDYINMLFPVTKWMGVSIGLLPYSSVGYSFGGTIDNGSSARSGEGSINQLYAGVGAQPVKGLAVGANISYMFGTITNNLSTVSSTSNTLFARYIEVRDYHLQFGAQYSRTFGKDHRITAGLTYAPRKSLLGHAWGEYGEYDSTNMTFTSDTIGYTSLKGKYSLAETWGAGLSYELGSRLRVEADFTFQPWSKAKFAAIEGFDSDTRFTDRYKVALGAQWMPQARGSYLKRCQYRIGCYTGRDYLMIGDNHINESGVTIGVGLPAPASKTMINIGLEYKNRKGSPQALVTENYFNITVGVNFNEMWFWRNKIR